MIEMYISRLIDVNRAECQIPVVSILSIRLNNKMAFVSYPATRHPLWGYHISISLSLFSFFVYLTPLVQSAAIDKFYMASIGDSYAAGAAVTSSQSYDDGFYCTRNKFAWEVQMAQDLSWTEKPVDFRFSACGGAQLVAATQADPENHQSTAQLDSAGTPQLLTMQLGGNNAHFGDIAKTCLYIGTSDGEYPDPASGCTQLINTWEAYVDSTDTTEQLSLYAAHHATLGRIMEWNTIKGRNDFYFYVMGYAEFFDTSPGSDWCNSESFGLPVISSKPKLSNALRSKMNELVRKANDRIQLSVTDMNNDRIKFLNPSALYEGHRFCQPGHNIDNQYFLNDVWFWNLSPPSLDPDYTNAGAQYTNADAEWQHKWVSDYVYPNGTQATTDELKALISDSNPFSTGRTFHPKAVGHTAMKDAMIAFLQANNVPGVKGPPPQASPLTTRPYETGQTHIHVNEYWGCLDDANNLSVDIQMWDSKGQLIGTLPRTQAGAAASARMGSKFENQLIVTPEWAQGGYIQFALGDLMFSSLDLDQSKPSFCKVGGYDPKEGPKCVINPPAGRGSIPRLDPGAISVRQMDCWFPAVSTHLII
jgi:hypothetical protein